MPMTMPTHMHMTRSYSFSSMLGRVSMHSSALGDLWLVVKMVFIVMGCLYDFMRPLVGRRRLMVMSCCCCCPSGPAGATDVGVAPVVDAGATDLGVAPVVGCCGHRRGVVVGRGHVLDAFVSVGSAVVVGCGVAAIVDLDGGPVLDAVLTVASVMVNCTVSIQSVLDRRHPLVMVNGTSLALSVPCCLSLSCQLSLLPMMMN
jgi:hypothetical protein